MKNIKFKKCLPWLLGISASVFMQTQAMAHHPISAKFDDDQSMALNGIVTKVDWRNPHAHIFVNVKDAEGNTVNWAVEVESPVILQQNGWQADSIKPGDAISVNGIAARNGSRQVWGESVAFSATGREVFVVNDAPQQIKPLVQRPAPRWPDGQIALGASPDSVDGYWAQPSETMLVEDGETIRANKYGLLASLRDADDVAPFQPWAEELFKLRQTRELQDDPMFINCKPPGGPRQFQSDLGIKFVEDRDKERVFVMMGGGNHNYRIMYLDGREPVGQVTGDDNNPLYYGRSVGEWQGDTLVIKTTSFNEDFWMSNGGLPHTGMLELEERFTRESMDTLRYEVVVNDPGAYTRPWTASWTLAWQGGQDLPTHFCQENRP